MSGQTPFFSAVHRFLLCGNEDDPSAPAPSDAVFGAWRTEKLSGFFLLVIQCLVENDADEDQKNSQDKKFQTGFLGVKCGQEINKLKQKSADEKQRD